jgi:hypothetical protein
MSAISILENLPTAATSLGGSSGAYTVHYPEDLVADWFYPVTATADINGAVLAKFLVAKDLSAVYRADDDITPVLIFGSAQPMLEAQIAVSPEDDATGDVGEDEASTEMYYELQSVSFVQLEDGTTLTVGSSDRLTASLPWDLTYAITAESSDTAVAVVDEDGVVTAVAVGETVITGTLSVDDGTKAYAIEISVIDTFDGDGETIDDAEQPTNAPDSDIDEDRASGYLLDRLILAGYEMDGTAVVTEQGDGESPFEDMGAWYFAWGKNTPEKFTAEKHFAVTNDWEIWEYDVLNDDWLLWD